MGDAVRKTGISARKMMLSAARKIVEDLENNKLSIPVFEANINILTGSFYVLSNAISMTAICLAHSTGNEEENDKVDSVGKGKGKGKGKGNGKGNGKGKNKGKGKGKGNDETEINDEAKENDETNDEEDVEIKRIRRSRRKSHRKLLSRCDNIVRIALDPICVKTQTPTLSTASSSSASATFKPSWNAINSNIGRPLWPDTDY